MPRHFTIDLGPSGTVQDDPLTFSFKGTVDGEAWEEFYECIPALPAGVMADLDSWSFPVAKSVEFIAGCLTDESAARFRDLIHDKTRIVKDTDLVDVVRRLLTEYSGRPTTPPAGSANGAATIGTSSTGG